MCYFENVPSNRTRTGEVEELAQGTGSGKSAVKSSGRGTGKGEVTWGVFYFSCSSSMSFGSSPPINGKFLYSPW